jgi:hypothetical protein
MSKPMLLAEFTRLPMQARAVTLDGLSGLIDVVAEGAPPRHRLLRYQWYEAAIAAHGGAARTIIVESDGDPVIALPITRLGPGWARLATVPGNRWPLRGFPARLEAGEAAFDALLGAVAREANGLALGPLPDHDPALTRLVDAARARGWAVLDRPTPFEPAPVSFDAAAEDPFWAKARADPVVAGALDAALAAPGDTATPRREWLLVRPGAPALLARLLAPWWRRSAG